MGIRPCLMVAVVNQTASLGCTVWFVVYCLRCPNSRKVRKAGYCEELVQKKPLKGAGTAVKSIEASESIICKPLPGSYTCHYVHCMCYNIHASLNRLLWKAL